MRKNHKRNHLKLSILAAVIGALPLSAGAAGLGKLTVLSALGQPLKAELEVAASRDEISSLTARVAPVETFRQANIDYATVLTGLRFSLEKRSDGRAYFNITSDRPVNDPFLDFLIELNWASGRLVREYTFLLDPPDAKQADQAMMTGMPEVKPAAGEEQPEAIGTQPQTSEQGMSRRPPASNAMGDTEPEAGEQRTVKSGDTLGRIAADLQPAGVSLDQMLVAMFKANPGAFDGNNMNRLRAGKVLMVPKADEIAAIGSMEARRTVIAHAVDFDAYRKRLASAAVSASPVGEEASRQQRGSLSPKLAEAPAASGGSDKLEVSRTQDGRSGAPSGKLKPTEEDLIARERALKEANSRIADLEKNLSDLKKLAELKAGAAAGATRSPAENAPEIKAQPPIAAPVKPTEGVAPPTKPARKALPPPPPPSFLEENGMLLVGGGGGLLALLAGYFGFTAWKRKRVAQSDSQVGFSEPGFAENSVFSAAQHVDTASTPIDGDSAGGEVVDPLQEAEVYLAYGRDSQAEEILLDALNATPTRLAIHNKLLEIYAARKSVPQFVTLAEDVHQQTGGAGAEWERALALGRVIDPTNPLFGGAVEEAVVAAPVETASEAAAPVVQPVAVEQAVAEPVAEAIPDTLDFDLDLGAPATEAPAAQSEAAVPAPAEQDVALDFDLDLGAPEPASEPVPPAAKEVVAEDASSNSLDIDFDLPDLAGAPAAPEPATVAPEPEAGNSIDFDLGEIATEPVAATAASDVENSADTPLDLDFDLGEPALPLAEAEAPPLDLSSINLDLDPLPAAGQSAAPVSDDNPEVATKLELAQAYQEMGDKEGARELLQEVLNEGSPTQQEAARNKLAELT